jgi:hypothetical protein
MARTRWPKGGDSAPANSRHWVRAATTSTRAPGATRAATLDRGARRLVGLIGRAEELRPSGVQTGEIDIAAPRRIAGEENMGVHHVAER